MPSPAHEVRPAYLQVRELSPNTYDVLWKVPARGGRRLSLSLELPRSCINSTEPHFQRTARSVSERWVVHCTEGLSDSTIRVDGLSASFIDVLVRVERLDDSTQIARLTPDSPSFSVAPVPGRREIALTYLKIGVEHILLGADHLLFVLALLLLVRGARPLVLSVTAFTIAHSLTLAATVLSSVNVPPAPVEACIALSIMFLAAEIIHARSGQPGLTAQYPWIAAFGFGLLHGFGFAGALRDVGLPEHAIPLALLLFNVGVEIGQLLFVGLALSAGALIVRYSVPGERLARRVAPYAIGCAGAFWLIERIASLGT